MGSYTSLYRIVTPEMLKIMKYSSGLTELDDIKKKFYLTEYQIACSGYNDEEDYEIKVPDNIRKYVYGKNETYPDWGYNPEFYRFIKVSDFFEMNEKYTVNWSYNSYYVSVYEDENYIKKKPSFKFPSSQLIWKKLYTKYLLAREISYEKRIVNPEYLVTSYFNFKDPNLVWEQKKVGDYIQFVDTPRMMEFKQKFIEPFDEGKTFFIIC